MLSGNMPSAIKRSTSSRNNDERNTVPSISNTATGFWSMPLWYRLLRFGPALTRRWPDTSQRMLCTVVWPSRTYVAAIEDEAVIHVFPVFLWNESFEVFGDFCEVGVAREVEPEREAPHVGI